MVFLKSFCTRRFLVADAILDGICRRRVCSLAGPVRFDCGWPDTAKGLALASLSSESDSWFRARYTLDLGCMGCNDPLRLLEPDFQLPAEFAHAQCTRRRFKYVPRVIVCHTCGRRFRHLWGEFALKQFWDSCRLIRLVRPWLDGTAPANL